jgi:hypothetical protein
MKLLDWTEQLASSSFALLHCQYPANACIHHPYDHHLVVTRIRLRVYHDRRRTCKFIRGDGDIPLSECLSTI